MKNNNLKIIVIGLTILVGVGAIVALLLSLGAASMFMISSSSGIQPTPIVGSIPDTGNQPVPTEAVPTSAPSQGKILAPAFDAQTYINQEAGFALEVPKQWTVSESVIGARASQVKFLSSPEIADMATLPAGETRVNATLYQWDPKHDLAAYLAHRKDAWESSGFTILYEEKSVHDGGLDVVQVILSTPDAQVTFLFAAVGDRYLEVSGEGDPDMVKEIFRTVRAISVP